jgi:hypothetical protein
LCSKGTTALHGTHYAAWDDVTQPLTAGRKMKYRSITISLLVLAGVACKSVSPAEGINLNEPAAVSVDNRGFSDMTVYVARDSQRQRLGLAQGNRVTVFTIPANMVGGATPLRFIADPIGSSRASVSEQITVSPGDTVVVMIPPG